MGAITAFSISAAIILAIEYIVYKSLLANATFYRFNRVVLLACYAAALIAIPVSHLLQGHIAGTTVATGGTMGGISIGAPMVEAIADAGAPESSGLIRVIPIIYIAGVALTGIFTLLSYIRMARIIRRGEKREIDGATVVVSETKVSPFSWGKYIVVSPADADNRLIIEHELTHVRNRHSIDLIFAQLFIIFNWFNPAAYLMRRELSAVHEYDVDRRILESGIKATDYQMLLIRKTVGPGFQSIANSLNHSQLKNRLTMMLRSKSRGVRCLCAAALLPAAMLAAAMTDFPAVASTISSVADVSYGKVSEKTASEQTPAATDTPAYAPVTDELPAANAAEEMPKYPGGERALLQTIMSEVKYTEAAMKEGYTGMAVVRFVVDANGDATDFELVKSTGYGDLDAEALRAIKAAMTEKWIPGKVDGKPVRCNFTLPIKFAIKKNSPEENKK